MNGGIHDMMTPGEFQESLECRQKVRAESAENEQERAMTTKYESDLAVLAEGCRLMDSWLDGNVSAAYKDQPLAQDWARVAKVAEELGEAIQVLISITRQNPRKQDQGYTTEDLVTELADTALTAMYAIQHFRKDDAEAAVRAVIERCTAHVRRLPPGGEPS